MSEDIADIIFEEGRKGTSYLVQIWYAVLKEIVSKKGRGDPEYVQKKSTVIVNELKKIWDNRI